MSSTSHAELIAGCFPPGPVKRSGAISCYAPQQGDYFIVLPAIYPELLEQGWRVCGDDLSAAIVGLTMCD
jgi:hypothetical protein